jgi:hypothetical protein
MLVVFATSSMVLLKVAFICENGYEHRGILS